MYVQHQLENRTYGDASPIIVAEALISSADSPCPTLNVTSGFGSRSTTFVWGCSSGESVWSILRFASEAPALSRSVAIVAVGVPKEPSFWRSRRRSGCSIGRLRVGEVLDLEVRMTAKKQECC
jgi:hypothetical protein